MQQTTKSPAGGGVAASESSALTRRRLISAFGKMGITFSAGLMAAEIIGVNDQAEAAPASFAKAKHAWCMVIDLRDCDGCAVCTASCQVRHSLPAEQEWMKVYTMTDSSGNTYYMPRPCMMCEDPPCVRTCPVGANFHDEDGLVLVNQDVCIGSRICMASCPYDARYFNWTEPPVPSEAMDPSPQMPVPQQKGTVGKCVFCADRLSQGELPACVSGCPMGAIFIGDLVTDVAVNSRGDTYKLSSFLKDNDAVRFKEEAGTNPRVWYIAGHGQNLETD